MTEPNRYEWGAEPPVPHPAELIGQPRNGGRYPTPHAEQFAALFGGISGAYWPQHDEALAHSRENSERVLLDPVVDKGLRLRTYPTSMLTYHIEPDDDEDPVQVKVAAEAQRLLKRMPGFTFAKQRLLSDGIFKGRSALKIRWQHVYKRGRIFMVPTAFEPVDGDKLVFFFDGSVGILVRPGFIGPTVAVPAGNGRAYVLTPEEREGLIVYNFEPTDASYYKPQRAGAIKGLGLRDKLYWLWALKTRVWGMGMDYLQWFAKGLLLLMFRSGNPEHARVLKEWVENQDGNSTMLLPSFVGNENPFDMVKHVTPSTTNAQYIQELTTNYFDRLITELIVGQTLTSGTAPTGLGSGVAGAHQTTFEQWIKYDTMGSDEVLTRDLLGPFYRTNYPGVPCGHFVSDLDNPNAQAMIENAKEIIAMGGAVPEEEVLDAAGLPQPKPGDTILSNVQPTQPAVTDGMPQGVPVTTADNDPNATPMG